MKIQQKRDIKNKVKKRRDDDDDDEINITPGLMPKLRKTVDKTMKKYIKSSYYKNGSDYMRKVIKKMKLTENAHNTRRINYLIKEWLKNNVTAEGSQGDSKKALLKQLAEANVEPAGNTEKKKPSVATATITSTDVETTSTSITSTTSEKINNTVVPAATLTSTTSTTSEKINNTVVTAATSSSAILQKITMIDQECQTDIMKPTMVSVTTQTLENNQEIVCIDLTIDDPEIKQENDMKDINLLLNATFW